MITFSKLGKKGNIGNQLFQIASVIGIAKSNNHDFAFPSWKYSSYFENKLPLLDKEEFTPFLEQQYYYKTIRLEYKDYDLEGWFQSEKYFINSDEVKHYFKFNEVAISNMKQQFKLIFQKRTILISIRRGDFVNHHDYFQLPINFYLNALLDHFPNYKDYNILILSDDVNYCKYHFSSLENVFFANKVDAVQQLILASLCDDFIISNSTFSWWCAWFGEKKDSKVIRPLHNFSLQKRVIFNDKDYFPDRWISYDFAAKKVNLSNVVMVLKNNDALLENYLKVNFSFLNQNNFYNFHEFYGSEVRYIIINKGMVPSPVVLFQASSLSKSTIFFIKGKLLKISRFLDEATFSKQFDFGIFARLMGKNELNGTKIALVYATNETDSIENILKSIKKNTFRNNSNFDINYCYSGKLISILECKFYMMTKLESWIRSVKKDIKRSINYKKK